MERSLSQRESTVIAMSELKEYKCPCCGGAINFDSQTGKMKCPYCDTEFEVEAMKELDKELEREKSAGDDMHWDVPAGNEWQPGEKEGVFLYICNSCGGEILADAVTGASVCPFCGNPVVMSEQFAGILRPDCIIPFKLDKKSAKEGFLKHLKGKTLLPKAFKDDSHIEEIKGIYVPFWLYDTDAEANIRYKATKVQVWSDANYTYTSTSFFSVLRGGNLAFESVPVDGSLKMPDELMDSIEPFDYSAAVPFKTAYLAGYLADKYDVSAKDSAERANRRIQNSTSEAFRTTVQGYASVTPEKTSIRLNAGRIRYALLPVWLLNTSWQGKNYTFAMNGQTGKFVGDLPLDNGALYRWFFGLTFGIAAAALLAFFIFWLL